MAFLRAQCVWIPKFNYTRKRQRGERLSTKRIFYVRGFVCVCRERLAATFLFLLCCLGKLSCSAAASAPRDVWNDVATSFLLHFYFGVRALGADKVQALLWRDSWVRVNGSEHTRLAPKTMHQNQHTSTYSIICLFCEMCLYSAIAIPAFGETNHLPSNSAARWIPSELVSTLFVFCAV